MCLGRRAPVRGVNASLTAPQLRPWVTCGASDPSVCGCRQAGLGGVLASHAVPAHREYFKAFQWNSGVALLACSVAAVLDALQGGVNVG